ncbi:MAG: hypothetical protein ACPGU5_01465 [Lishizhenia sp.]
MKSLLIQPLFLFVSFGYIIYFICKKLNLAMHPILRNYWADFCCLFIINTIVLALIRKVKNQQQLELSVAQLVFSFLTCFLLFEVILPNYNTNYTSDFYDGIAYFLGLVLYYLWRKKSKKPY